MPSAFWRLCRLLLLLPTLAAATAVNAQPAANTPSSELPRFLVYFDEFSANLSDEAKTVIADAAKRARDSGAKAIVVQARELYRYRGNQQVFGTDAQLDRDGSARGGRHCTDDGPPGADRADRVGRSHRLQPPGRHRAAALTAPSPVVDAS